MAIRLPADERLLRATRHAIGAYLQEFGTSAEVVDDVILAVNEGCSNVLRHAFPNVVTGSYLLRADLRPDQVQVEVVDDGIGFDAKHHETAEFLAVAGRGLEIMRRLMTTVEIESPTSNGGTRLRMKKLLTSTVDTPDK